MKIFYYRLIKIGTFRNMVGQDIKWEVKASYEFNKYNTIYYFMYIFKYVKFFFIITKIINYVIKLIK